MPEMEASGRAKNGEEEFRRRSRRWRRRAEGRNVEVSEIVGGGPSRSAVAVAVAVAGNPSPSLRRLDSAGVASRLLSLAFD